MDSEELKAMPADIESDIDALLALNILRTHSHLGPFLDSGLRELQLTGVQFNVLLLLHAAGPDGLSLSEIGHRLVVTKANVTGLIDRLEHKGAVYRDTSTDRRVTVAKLTPEGSKLVHESLPHHRELLAAPFQHLTPQEKRTLIQLLTKLRHGLRECCRDHHHHHHHHHKETAA
jgi:MarR family 2-MHQ and catechol resistance regulon transcriptional repressor